MRFCLADIFIFMIVMVTLFETDEKFGPGKVSATLNTLMIGGMFVSVLIALEIIINVITWCRVRRLK